MSLRAEQLINNSKHIVTPDTEETRQGGTPQPPKQQQGMRSERSGRTPGVEGEEERIEEVKQVETEERQEPEGRQADTTVTECDRREVRMQLLVGICLRASLMFDPGIIILFLLLFSLIKFILALKHKCKYYNSVWKNVVKICCPIVTFIMLVLVFVFAPLLCLLQVRDVWYEAGSVWYVHKDGFTLGEFSTQP